jgi:hypothetical protein
MIYDNSEVDGKPILIASRTMGNPLKYHSPGLNPLIDLTLEAAFRESL